MTVTNDAPTSGAERGFPDLRQLNALAIRGLGPMFDASKGLFCYTLKLEGSSLVQEGLSPRYTMMTCLGLQRAKAAGYDHPFDCQAILGRLLRNTDWIDDIGDLGLLLWLCAIESPEELRSLCARTKVHGAPERFVQAQQGRTMQMAWFLTGLAYASQAVPELSGDLEGVAAASYRTLTGNQGRDGVFGHLRGSIGSFLRSHIGSFADQVYPIIACTRYAEAFKAVEALERAKACAEMICRHQGSRGQWWWHYSAMTGKVIEKYPVYSVHQDGMAPMALFEVGEAVQRDFSGPIYKGLSWITGSNELGLDLREPATGVIWRSFYRNSNYGRQISRVLGALGCEGNEQPGSALEIRRECRPYHFGWLLYAFAGREHAGVRS